MPSLFITTPGTRGSLVSERLHIEAPPNNGDSEPVVRDIPLVDIEQVVVSERAHLTIAAVAELCRREIPIGPHFAHRPRSRSLSAARAEFDRPHGTIPACAGP